MSTYFSSVRVRACFEWLPHTVTLSVCIKSNTQRTVTDVSPLLRVSDLILICTVALPDTDNGELSSESSSSEEIAKNQGSISLLIAVKDCFSHKQLSAGASRDAVG